MIHLIDIYGKTWSFKKRSVEGIHIDSPNPKQLVTVKVGPAKIKTRLDALEEAMPHLTEDIEIKH